VISVRDIYDNLDKYTDFIDVPFSFPSGGKKGYLTKKGGTLYWRQPITSSDNTVVKVSSASPWSSYYVQEEAINKYLHKPCVPKTTARKSIVSSMAELPDIKEISSATFMDFLKNSKNIQFSYDSNKNLWSITFCIEKFNCPDFISGEIKKESLEECMTEYNSYLRSFIDELRDVSREIEALIYKN
jgi:hypothetical protein